jgi:hypothetical protein
VCVFSDALDRNWRVEMSRAKVERDPNGAADCVFFIGKHYIHTSSPFVASVTNKGFLTPLGSIARGFYPSKATGGGALGHDHAGAWYGNLQRDDSHQRVDVGRGIQPRPGGLVSNYQWCLYVEKRPRLRWMNSVCRVNLDAQVSLMHSRPIEEGTVPQDASED